MVPTSSSCRNCALGSFALTGVDEGVYVVDKSHYGVPLEGPSHPPTYDQSRLLQENQSTRSLSLVSHVQSWKNIIIVSLCRRIQSLCRIVSVCRKTKEILMISSLSRLYEIVIQYIGPKFQQSFIKFRPKVTNV